MGYYKKITTDGDHTLTSKSGGAQTPKVRITKLNIANHTSNQKNNITLKLDDGLGNANSVITLLRTQLPALVSLQYDVIKYDASYYSFIINTDDLGGTTAIDVAFNGERLYTRDQLDYNS